MRGTNGRLSPRCPRMAMNVGLDIGNDNGSAAHHTTAEENDLRIIGMHLRNSICGPDVQATITHAYSDRVSLCGLLKQNTKIDFCALRERTGRKARPLSGDERHGPSRSF